MLKTNSIKAILLIALSTIGLSACANKPTAEAKQMIIVTAKDWNTSTGTLQRFERMSIDAPWQKVGKETAVQLGKNGMAWGTGLHEAPLTKEGLVITAEGMKRSPVGVFSIPVAFGRDEASNWSVKMPYVKITKTIFCSGDPESKNYNHLVDASKEPKEDWSKGEDMQDYVNQGVYTYGAMISHNYSPTKPGHGSCFFIHVWRGPDKPTAGCTGMAETDTKEIVSWLDPEKNPVLVQLPETIYSEVKNKWDLPDLQIPTAQKEL